MQRRAVRVLVVDDTGHVLMIHGCDPHQPDVTYWYTVGGGVDDGESEREAAVRELWEETGRRVAPADLLGPVHADEVVFPFEGQVIHQQQVFFALLTPRYTAVPVAFEETELRSTVGIEWIDPRATQMAGGTVYPLDLAHLVTRVVASTS